jgi:hypothetical protein
VTCSPAEERAVASNSSIRRRYTFRLLFLVTHTPFSNLHYALLPLYLTSSRAPGRCRYISLVILGCTLALKILIVPTAIVYPIQDPCPVPRAPLERVVDAGTRLRFYSGRQLLNSVSLSRPSRLRSLYIIVLKFNTYKLLAATTDCLGTLQSSGSSTTETADFANCLPQSKLCSVSFTTTNSDTAQAFASQNIIALQ